MITNELFDAALAAGRVELEARRDYLRALASRAAFATFDEYRTARTAAREAMRAAQNAAHAALEAYRAAERTEHARIVADLAARDGFLAASDGPLTTACTNTIVHGAAPETSHAEDAIAHGALGRTFELRTEDDTRAGLATWAQLRASLATHEGWIDVDGVRCFAAGDVQALRAALAAHDEIVGLFGVEVAR